MAKKKEAPKTGLFTHLDAIYTDKSAEYFDTLSDKEKKGYSQYMINRFISMNPHQLDLVNMVQAYGKIPNRAHYLFFARMTPRRKQYNTYIKPSKKKEYPDWLVPLLVKHYNVSISHAMEYLDIFMSCTEHITSLKEICRGYGIDDKQLKELDHEQK